MIVLPDGTRIWGRGRRRGRPDSPEFGLYLGKDRGERYPWPVEWIDWPDFRVPRDPEHAAAAIERAYLRAKAGERVEVTCGGGNGRTGTAVACMAILAGHPAADAVAWTRANYRRHAVETPWQRRWVERFRTPRAPAG